jgi:DNA processing protein
VSLSPDDAEDLEHWLRLALTPGVGPVGARALLEQFGLPHAIFESGGGLLDEVAGGRLASALRSSARRRTEAPPVSVTWRLRSSSDTSPASLASVTSNTSR